MSAVRKFWPYLAGGAVFLGVFVYLVLTYRFAPVKVGMVAPDFQLKTVDGDHLRLSSYRGKVVMLNFWATWCKPCKQEMPSMEMMYEGMKQKSGDKFVLIAVNENNMFYANQVKPFLQSHNIHFLIPLDPLNRLDHKYKITGVPETFVLDQNGVVAQHIIGPRNWIVRRNLDLVLSLLDKGPLTPKDYLAQKTKEDSSGY
ncbi:MAG: TlpA disulfide reductase family protein [Leptospirales bacterium]